MSKPRNWTKIVPCAYRWCWITEITQAEQSNNLSEYQLTLVMWHFSVKYEAISEIFLRNWQSIFKDQMHNCNALWVRNTSGVTIVDSLPQLSKGRSHQVHFNFQTNGTTLMMAARIPPRPRAEGKSVRACWTTHEMQPLSSIPVMIHPLTMRWHAGMITDLLQFGLVRILQVTFNLKDGDARNWTRGLIHAKHALYHWATSPPSYGN